VVEPLWAAQAAYEKALASYNATVDGATDNERWSAWTRVQLAQATLDRLLEQPTDEAVRLAEIALTQAEIDLAQAEHELAEATLRAPIPGTVTAVYVEKGEITNGVALVIGTLDRLAVDLVLDETDVVQIEVEQPAVVTLDALDDVELLGRITYIAPTADIESGVVLFAVTVTLDPTDEAVRAGMTADVEIVTTRVEDVLLVPVKAVQEVNGRTIVLRKSAEGEGRRSGRESFVPVPVETGLVSETQVEILSGLEEGDEIVVANPAGVREEMEERPPFGFGGPGMPGAAP
jgi:HlyD family secretion protein